MAPEPVQFTMAPEPVQFTMAPEPARKEQRSCRGCGWVSSIGRYARRNYWELPANALEAFALVLVVFVQDLAFKESIVATAGLLTLSFILHGLGYRAGQCQVWPKVIEMAAPLLFYGMIPAAYLATFPTYRGAFIIINFWFAGVELLFMALGRNFILEYFQDWNPREVWGTPLFEHCARVVSITWVVCQVIMGLAQVFVVAFNISLETNVVAAVVMCYAMQLLPVVWAVAFTFIYPARVKRRWGYVHGVRATCYPQPAAAAAGQQDLEASVELDDGGKHDLVGDIENKGTQGAGKDNIGVLCEARDASVRSSGWLLRAGSIRSLLGSNSSGSCGNRAAGSFSGNRIQHGDSGSSSSSSNDVLDARVVIDPAQDKDVDNNSN